VAAVEGIDEASVSRFLEAALEGAVPPFSFELVSGGRSNLTYAVTDAAGRRVALRRPPVGHVLPTAHDMAREHRIVAALGPTAVPVPRALAFCADVSVTGAPFYVMEFVEGHVLRDAKGVAAALPLPARRRLGEDLIDVLVALHGLDVDAVGLGDLGRRDGYLERQLARWRGQFDRSQVEGEERVEAVDEVHALLVGSVPSQGAPALVHGDYRIDNTVVSDEGEVRAVLDWELCTLGDPLADLGLLMVYWAEPGDELTALGNDAPTLAGGFPTREEMAARYAARSGRDLVGLDYYVAFGYWKLACILQGVHARYRAGAGGGDRSGTEVFRDQVRALAGAAQTAIRRLEAAG